MGGGRLTRVAGALWMAAVVAFVLAPLVIVVVVSLSESGGRSWPPSGFSLRWYAQVFAYRPFRQGALNSVLIATIATVFMLVVGTMAAYAIARYRFVGRGALRALFVAPLSVPRIVTGFSLFVLYISIVPSLYGSLIGVALAHCLLLLPFVVGIMGAAIANTEPVLEDAGRDLGYGPLRTFLRVTLPQLRIGLITAAAFAFSTSFDEVDTSIFLIRPGSSTLPIEMFLYLQQSQDPTLAALSTLLIALSAVVVAVVALSAGAGGLLKTLSLSGRRVSR